MIALKTFDNQPSIKELEQFSEECIIAKCKDKAQNIVWAVIDFKEVNKNGNKTQA